ncbi:MAG: hypothetical protein ACR2P1_26365, partial [Pseudomonadales bacterium]
LFSTAMTFHIVSIFTAAGRTPSNAFSYFVPMAIIAVATNLLVSWLSDSIAMKPFLIIKLTAFICGTYGLLNLDHEYGYCITVIGFGITTGIWGALNTLVFVRFFGRLYLGEISGINAAFSVFGSAIGPAFFSVVYDQFGSYGPAMLLSIAVLSLLLLTAIAIPQPEPIRVSA